MKLDGVTLSIVEALNVDLAVKALRISSKELEFEQIKLLSTKPPTIELPSNITYVPIPPMDFGGYSRFVLFNFYDYIDTPFVLQIQRDGFVVDAKQWSPDFLQYDFLGCTWDRPSLISSKWVDDSIRDKITNFVGNGGFCLRSKKLLEVTKNAPFPCNGPEDVYICVNHYNYFIEQGIKFAPEEVANRFSREQYSYWEGKGDVFGFHGDPIKINKYKVTGEKYESVI